MSGKSQTIHYISILFILSLIVMLRQLLSSDYFSIIIDDTFAHTSWAWQFTEALKEGVIYPRWMPLNFWGYGSPTFILYPPLAYYLVAFFNVFTDSIISAMNIVKLVSLFLSAVGMFFLVREFYPLKTAFLTSAFYIILPYNVSNVYLSGTFASTISLIWFSPILIFTFKYINTGCYKYIIYAGASYGGLILTHLINAYMFTFLWVIFIIYFAIYKKRLLHLKAISFIGITGALVSSAYLLPLIYEKRFVDIETFVKDFNYADYFILPNLTSKLPQHLFWPVYYKEFVFYVLLFSILTALSFLQIKKLSRFEVAEDSGVQYAVNKFFLGTVILSIFLLFGPSAFFWKNIPFFKYIQFPARWLNITSFAVVFLSASLFYALHAFKNEKTYHLLAILTLVTVCLLYDYRYISSAPVFTKQELIPVRAVNWTNEHMPANVSFEVLYKNRDSKEKIEVRGEGKVEIVKWESSERIIKTVAFEPIILRIRTFYFPGWKAYLDGRQVEIKTEEGTGAMLIDIAGGEHLLQLKFEDTPVRFYGKIISIVSFLSIIVFIIVERSKIYTNLSH